MNVLNHYKMGCVIYKSMTNNTMPLNRFFFLLGNLAPDIFFSFCYRPHQYASSGPHIKGQIQRLCYGVATPRSASFSFNLGIIAHYVCDYFCYAHSPAFRGSSHEHYLYEKKQTVKAGEMLPFEKQESTNLDFSELIGTLDNHIMVRQKLFAQSPEMATNTDVPVAIHMAAWTASATYLSAERAVSSSPVKAKGACAEAGL